MGINLNAAIGFAGAGALGGMGLTMLQAGNAGARSTDAPFAAGASTIGGIGGMWAGMRASNSALTRIAMDGITTGGRVAAAGAFLGAIAVTATPGFVLARSVD